MVNNDESSQNRFQKSPYYRSSINNMMNTPFALLLLLLTSVATSAQKADCPPICKMYCEFGYVIDANGCQTCRCRERPTISNICPLIRCSRHCPNGYKVDDNGCQGCGCVEDNVPPTVGGICPGGEEFDSVTNQCVAVSCKSPNACGPGEACSPVQLDCVRAPCPQFQCQFHCPPVCAVYCEFGNVLDHNGCSTCQCNPPPSCGVGQEYDTLTKTCVVVSCESPEACESNEVCQSVDIQCVRAPCPRFQCQPTCSHGEILVFGKCRAVSCNSKQACWRGARCVPRTRTCHTRQLYCPQYYCKSWWQFW